MTLYNSIGKGYNSTRKPDSRIVEQLLDLLDLPIGSKVADIGAGTGNYSNAIANRGYQVIAIEPSVVMQSQKQAHPNVSWLTTPAEQILLPDRTVDGAIIMLAMHHFDDLNKAIKEINRITTNGKLVAFAFEQDKIADFWLSDYFPYFVRDPVATLPSTKTIARLISQCTEKETAIIPYLLPYDLNDLFAASGWRRPEIYLNLRVRQGISSFAKMPDRELEQGIKQLEIELNNGMWLEKYGHLLKLKTYDAGYRIITT